MKYYLMPVQMAINKNNTTDIDNVEKRESLYITGRDVHGTAATETSMVISPQIINRTII